MPHPSESEQVSPARLARASPSRTACALERASPSTGRGTSSRAGPAAGRGDERGSTPHVDLVADEGSGDTSSGENGAGLGEDAVVGDGSEDGRGLVLRRGLCRRHGADQDERQRRRPRLMRARRARPGGRGRRRRRAARGNRGGRKTDSRRKPCEEDRTQARVSMPAPSIAWGAGSRATDLAATETEGATRAAGRAGFGGEKGREGEAKRPGGAARQRLGRAEGRRRPVWRWVCPREDIPARRERATIRDDMMQRGWLTR